MYSAAPDLIVPLTYKAEKANGGIMRSSDVPAYSVTDAFHVPIMPLNLPVWAPNSPLGSAADKKKTNTVLFLDLPCFPLRLYSVLIILLLWLLTSLWYSQLIWLVWS